MKLIILDKLLTIAGVLCGDSIQKIHDQSMSIYITGIDIEKNMPTVKNKSMIKNNSIKKTNSKIFKSLVKIFNKENKINKIIVDLLKLKVSDAGLRNFISKKPIRKNKALLENIEEHFTLNFESEFYLTYYAIYDGLYPDTFTAMDKEQYHEYISNPNSLFTNNCAKMFKRYGFTLEEAFELKKNMLRNKELYFPRAANVYNQILKQIFDLKTINFDSDIQNIKSRLNSQMQLNEFDVEKTRNILETFQFIYENGLAGFLKNGTISNFLCFFEKNVYFDGENVIKLHDFVIGLLKLCPKSDKIAYSARLLPYLSNRAYDINEIIRIINFFSIPASNRKLDVNNHYHPCIFKFLNTIKVGNLEFIDLTRLLKNVLPRQYSKESQKLWLTFFNNVYDYIYINCKTELEKEELVYIMIFYPGNPHFSTLYKLTERNNNESRLFYLDKATQREFKRFAYIENLNHIYASHDSVALNF